MIKFITKLTGSVMWVSEDRAEEYKKAGHKPDEEPAKPQPKKGTKKK